MPRENVSLHAFNRGLISPLALARTDIERVGLSAETYTNWVPRNLGSMMLRPGTKYIGTHATTPPRVIPFKYSSTDSAIISLTDLAMKVWVSDAVISRPSISTTIAVTDADMSIGAGWVDNDGAGAASTFVTYPYDSGSYSMKLLGDQHAAQARRTLAVTVAAADQNIEHSLAIRIYLGPVTLRVGSTSGGDDYISETELDTGYHSLALTPTGTFYIDFSSRLERAVYVSSCDIESSGDMTVTTPWAEADLQNINFDQSGDIIFVACDGYHPYKIERRATRSWSVVKYEANDGPFRPINTSSNSISTNAVIGSATLSARQNLFDVNDHGRLFRISTDGRSVNTGLYSANIYTNPIRVYGVGDLRILTINITGTWVGTLTLQYSDSEDGPWINTATTYTVNGNNTFDDTFDNRIYWYRLGFTAYTSGTATIGMSLNQGAVDGIAKLFTATTATSAAAEVFTRFGTTGYYVDWYRGAWGPGTYPTAVAFAEGRLGWAGQGKLWLSASDDFYVFDDTDTGDSATIQKTIGSGPIVKVNWMVGAKRLLLGTDSSEYNLLSSTQDEILTPSSANLKEFSTYGSAKVSAVKLDTSAIYVEEGGAKLLEAAYGDNYEYITNNLSALYPEVGDSPITRIAIQRKPDTRIHCVRSDGSVMILIHDKGEDVSCWVKYTSGGTVTDVVVLPGASGDKEDAVYYSILRGSNYYLEKWALESQCQGGTVNRQLDSHIVYSGASTTSITGLDHLEGDTVAIWGSGKDLGTATVSSGAITVSEAVTDACVGLSYTAQWKSSKLAYAAGLGSALAQKKAVNTLGVILVNTHYQGLEYGPNFTSMDNLPLVKDGATVAADTVHAAYDEESFVFRGQWDTDSRLCLQATAPKPCTVLAAIIGVETHDRY